MSVHFLLKEIHKVNDLGAVLAIMVDENGQPMVPVHPVVEAIGLGYADEYQRLKGDRRFGASKMRVRHGDDVIEEVVVPLTKLHAFLFSINPDHVSPEAAARRELFQNECVDVLNDYWNKGMAINDRLERGNTEGTNYRDARKLSIPARCRASDRPRNRGRERPERRRAVPERTDRSGTGEHR